MFTLNEAQQLATIVASFVASIGLVGAFYQLLLNARSARATLWLKIREMMAVHDEIYLNLLSNGPWYASEKHPTLKEVPKVADYLGLFEHCEYMLDAGLIDMGTFRNIYAYRLKSILENPLIVEILAANPQGWKAFLTLLGRVELWEDFKSALIKLKLFDIFNENIYKNKDEKTLKYEKSFRKYVLCKLVNGDWGNR